MGHKIELQAIFDSKGITRGVKELSGVIDTAFKAKGTDIFSPETMSFLKGEASTAVNNLQKSMGQLRNEAAGIDKQLKEGVKSEVAKNKLIKDRLAITKQMATAERELANLTKQQKAAFPEQKRGMERMFQKMGIGKDNSNLPGIKNVTPRKERGKLATMGQGVGNAVGTVAGATRSPVLGAASQVGGAAARGASAASAAGMGAAGIAALGGLAVVAGGAAIAISRMSTAAELFRESIPQQLQLEAIDNGVNNRGLNAGARLGYEPGQVMNTQIGLSRSMGTAANAQEGGNRIANTLLASRSLGLDPEEITSGANQIRQTGGTDAASKGMAKILSKAMTDGMDKSQSSFFLAASVGLLTDLNKNGMSNADAMLSAMTDLVANKAMSPEMAAKTMKSMNDAISGSTGESNMFFQTAAARGMPGGGKNIFSTQAMVSQGLSGMDVGATGNMLQGSKSAGKSMDFFKEAGLFDENYTQNFAKSVTGELSNRFGDQGQEAHAAKLDFVGQNFGTRNMGESAKVLSVLERLAEGKGTKADEKTLTEMSKDPAVRWQDNVLSQLNTIAGHTALLGAKGKKVQFDLGKDAQAKIFNPLKEAVIAMDQAIHRSDIATPMGALADSMKTLAETLGGFINTLQESAIGKMMGLGKEPTSKDIVEEGWANQESAAVKDGPWHEGAKGITKRLKNDPMGRFASEITPDEYKKMSADPSMRGTKMGVDARRETLGLPAMSEVIEKLAEQNAIAKAQLNLQEKQAKNPNAPRTQRTSN